GLLTPVAHLSPELRQAVARLWIQPKFYAAIAEQIAALPELAAEVLAQERPLQIPVGVISASEPSPERIAEQEAAARLSPRGWHVVAPPCGHWVQLDQPEYVIAAIRRVAESAGVAPA
ncbi:MAG: alpha/beta fold hydrolase, partial [Terriglobales bacterium]